MTAPTTVRYCCECDLHPAILRGMCAGCNAAADREERLRDLTAAQPWEFTDQGDEEMEP